MLLHQWATKILKMKGWMGHFYQKKKKFYEEKEVLMQCQWYEKIKIAKLTATATKWVRYCKLICKQQISSPYCQKLSKSKSIILNFSNSYKYSYLFIYYNSYVIYFWRPCNLESKLLEMWNWFQTCNTVLSISHTYLWFCFKHGNHLQKKKKTWGSNQVLFERQNTFFTCILKGSTQFLNSPLLCKVWLIFLPPNKMLTWNVKPPMKSWRPFKNYIERHNLPLTCRDNEFSKKFLVSNLQATLNRSPYWVLSFKN
jgi:hypothetical protein